jgi:hypothetical protein
VRTPGREATPAEEAASAAGAERRDDARADRVAARIGPGLDNAADDLVAHDGAVVLTDLAPVIDVEIRTAQAGAFDPHDRVTVVLEPGIGDGFVADRADAAERQCAHR